MHRPLFVTELFYHAVHLFVKSAVQCIRRERFLQRVFIKQFIPDYLADRFCDAGLLLWDQSRRKRQGKFADFHRMERAEQHFDRNPVRDKTDQAADHRRGNYF